MRKAILAAVLFAVALSGSGASAVDLAAGECDGIRNPGPYQVSCTFTLQEFGRVHFYGTGGPASTGGLVVVEVSLVSNRDVVLFQCTGSGRTREGFPSGPIATCTGRHRVTAYAPGTKLRCASRGNGYGPFGCLSF